MLLLVLQAPLDDIRQLGVVVDAAAVEPSADRLVDVPAIGEHLRQRWPREQAAPRRGETARPRSCSRS